MNIRELKQSARTSLKGKWLLAIGACVIVGVITSLLSGSVTTTQNFLGEESFRVSFTFAFGFLITMPLQVGLSWFFLDIYDGKDVDMKQLFDGFRYYRKVLVASILIQIFIFLWALLFIIPGIIKGISYSQTLFIIKENPEIGIMDAIKESQRMMNGYKWTYFLTGLSFIGWYLAPFIGILVAALLLLIGEALFLPVFLLIASLLYILGFAFYVVPYYSTTFAGFYRELTRKSID